MHLKNLSTKWLNKPLRAGPYGGPAGDSILFSSRIPYGPADLVSFIANGLG